MISWDYGNNYVFSADFPDIFWGIFARARVHTKFARQLRTPPSRSGGRAEFRSPACFHPKNVQYLHNIIALAPHLHRTTTHLREK